MADQCATDQAALDSARYVDDELERLLCANGGSRFELDHFLSPPPELADGWLGDTAIPSPPRNKHVPTGLTTSHVLPSTRTDATSNALQHSRMQGNRQHQGMRPSAKVTEAPHHDVTRDEKTVQGFRRHSCDDQNVGVSLYVENGPNEGVLLDASQYGATSASRDMDSETIRNVVEEPLGDEASSSVRRQNGNVRDTGECLIKNWGLKDPKVARAMMKRMRRIRKFHDGEVRRDVLSHLWQRGFHDLP